MNSDHRRHRDFDQDNDRHEAHHSKIGKDATIAEERYRSVGAKASRNKNVKIIVMMMKIIEIMKIEVFNITKIIMN